MRRFAVFLFALILPAMAFATCPAGYYNAAPSAPDSDGDGRQYKSHSDNTYANYNPDGDLASGQWKVTWTNVGTVNGISSCNNTVGIQGDTIYSSDSFDTTTISGKECWYKITSWTDSAGSVTDLSGPWVYLSGQGSVSNCDHYCSSNSSYSVLQAPTLRSAVFNAAEACTACSETLPANAHWTSNGTTATNCAWECDAGYYGSSANGDTSCSACGSGYFCTGGTNRTSCESIINYAGTTPDRMNVYTISNEDWSNDGNAVRATDCVCQYFYHSDSASTFLKETRCPNGPGGYASTYIYYYWCNTGYYASDPRGWGNWYRACTACTNKPANSHYTSYSTPSEMYAVEDNCPWACDDGYGQHGGSCLPLCSAGFTKLKTGTGLSFNVYANRTSTPAINIGHNNTVCYVNLESGRGNMNVDFNGTIYHATD